MSSPQTTAGGDWTVRRVLDWTIGHLKQHGSETPRLDAEVLLAHAWDCRRIQLYTRFDVPLPEDVRARMRSLVKRRAAAEPVAYLVGHREFFSLDFEVQPGVFIPRPATETLVMEAIAHLKKLPQPRVLDLCTGSGCVAISIAHGVPQAQVTAVDLNPLALEVAARNAAKHGVADRVTLLQGDLFATVPAGAQFDLIVSNPPYVRDDEMSQLPADVRDHEPHLALAAGGDGLDVIRRIFADAPPFLAPQSALLIELSPEHAQVARGLLEETQLFSTVEVIRDLDRAERVVRGVR